MSEEDSGWSPWKVVLATTAVWGLIALGCCGGTFLMCDRGSQDISQETGSILQADLYEVAYVDWSVTEQTNSWHRISYQGVLVGGYPERSRVALDIQFLDEDDYVVKSVTERVDVPAAGEEPVEVSFRDDTLVRMPGAESVTSVEADLR